MKKSLGDKELSVLASQHFYLLANGVVKELSTMTGRPAKTLTDISLNATLLPTPSVPYVSAEQFLPP